MATTVPGGHYLGVDGDAHDAEGRPVAAKVAKEAVKIAQADDAEAADETAARSRAEKSSAAEPKAKRR